MTTSGEFGDKGNVQIQCEMTSGWEIEAARRDMLCAGNHARCTVHAACSRGPCDTRDQDKDQERLNTPTFLASYIYSEIPLSRYLIPCEYTSRYSQENTSPLIDYHTWKMSTAGNLHTYYSFIYFSPSCGTAQIPKT